MTDQTKEKIMTDIEMRKRMPSLLIDKGMKAYEEAVAANRSTRDPYRATRAGVHAAMWEAQLAATQKASDEVPAGDFHKLFPEEFEDAHAAAAGAYMGNKAATGSHHDALRVAVEEAFNAGVKVGRDDA